MRHGNLPTQRSYDKAYNLTAITPTQLRGSMFNTITAKRPDKPRHLDG
ncbi:hypothetical protein OH690_05310 [Escherichia coli]|nr:hypothetical protein [Escherichia coli]